MRHLHSEFHFRHALFALQSPDGYVEALLEMARDAGAGRHGLGVLRRPKARLGGAGDEAATRGGPHGRR